MKILVLNCGSSSIKYQLVDMANNAEVMAKGLLERIGLEMGEFTHKYHGEKHYEQLPIPDHTAGIKIVLNALIDPHFASAVIFAERYTEAVMGASRRILKEYGSPLTADTPDKEIE